MEQILQKTAEEIQKSIPLFFKYILRSDQNKAENGLSRVHVEIMDALDYAEKDGEMISMKTLAGRLLISKAYTTALTEKLFDEDLLDRIPDAKDRRIINVVLTEKGKKTLENIKHDLIEGYKQKLSTLSADDLKRLYSAVMETWEIVSKITA